ncbi:CAAX protease self-immunity-domain-containing protein [Haematococcus lacustris]
MLASGSRPSHTSHSSHPWHTTAPVLRCCVQGLSHPGRWQRSSSLHSHASHCPAAPEPDAASCSDSLTPAQPAVRPAGAAAAGDSTAEAPGHPAAEAWFSLPRVPWGMAKTVQVMVLWLLAYIIIGQVAMPMCLGLLGKTQEELSVRGHALMHLCLDMAQLAVTLLILKHCLKQYQPRKRGLFPVRLGGYWWLVVAAACTVFPLVDWVAVQSVEWFPLETGEVWASQIEASLLGGDWLTNTLYFAIVAICAPLWEEAIFRGFLLASLARYMPPAAAIATSSLLFAMCHFRLQTFLPLLILGCVFSCVYITTRNLLPPTLLHSLWNVFVLVNLLLRPQGAG